MEVITPMKAARMPVRIGRPTKNEHVYRALFALQVGQVLHIERSEWRIKSPPYWTVNPVARMRKSPVRFSCKELAGGAGWLITRIK